MLCLEVRMWGLMWIHVADEQRWRQAFPRHEAVGQRYGATARHVYRGADDPCDLLVAVRFPSRAYAEAFFADPDLELCLQEAGIDRPAIFSFSEPALVPA
jgi:hypothetical protein